MNNIIIINITVVIIVIIIINITKISRFFLLVFLWQGTL